MDRLVIRDGELRGAITSVRASRNEFAQAITRTDALQHAVGHRRLSDALQTFESRWSVRREKLVTTLEMIEKQLQGVLDTFGEWDQANTSPQSSGGAAPQAPNTAAAAPSQPVAPVGSTPGTAPATAPTPMPATPESVTPQIDTAPPPDPTLPSDARSSSPEADLDTLPERGDSPAALPVSPGAINDLLDRLERLADTPAGLAALTGSVGALVVLLALFTPGSAVAPGLAGVDGARVKKLLERHTASTQDKFAELSSAPAPMGSAELDIERQLVELDGGTASEPEQPNRALEEDGVSDAGESADEVEGESEGAAVDAAGDSASDVAISGSPTSGEGPGAPQSSVDVGAHGSVPLAEMPPPPEPPGSLGGDLSATSNAFDERFPDSGARDGFDVPAVQPALRAMDIDTELAALADDDASNDSDSSTPSGARMSGMGSMAAASTGHAATPAQAKGSNASSDERLAAVRRELDELRDPSTDKDGTS